MPLSPPAPLASFAPAARGRRSLRAGGVGALALLLIAGQLLTFIHFIVVRHAVCPEHGEWVHVGDGPHDETKATHAGAPATPAPGIRTAFASEPTHAPDHCVLAFHRRERGDARPAAVGVRIITVALAAIAPPLTDDRASHPEPLLRLAPKSSPPA